MPKASETTNFISLDNAFRVRVYTGDELIHSENIETATFTEALIALVGNCVREFGYREWHQLEDVKIVMRRTKRKEEAISIPKKKRKK